MCIYSPKNIICKRRVGGIAFYPTSQDPRTCYENETSPANNKHMDMMNGVEEGVDTTLAASPIVCSQKAPLT